MRYDHAGRRGPGEVRSSGSAAYQAGNASAPGKNPNTQPTDGGSTGDSTSDAAIRAGRAAGNSTKPPPGQVAGGQAPSMTRTHAGQRRSSEVR